MEGVNTRTWIGRREGDRIFTERTGIRLKMCYTITEQSKKEGKLYMETIQELRAALHACPRLSGDETDAIKLLADFLRAHTTLDVYELDNRMVALYHGREGAETVAFRADVDAIPGEHGPYHGCGHDGHSAVLAGLALWLEAHRPEQNVVLLFQNSEETGEGAKPLRDLVFPKLHIDRIYGLHNLPGWPEGVIVSRPGTFACASRGFIAKVTGSQSHAAYPEQGRNPAQLLSRAVLALPQLRAEAEGADFDGLLMSTVVALEVGAENFGVSAGSGRLCLTLRSTSLEALERFEQLLRQKLETECAAEGMQVHFEVRDAFPDTVSDDAMLADARARWEKAGLPQQELAEPMRWSEDFGWYLKEAPGVFFGVGAGESWPGLHTPEYHFNDAVLDRAVAAFAALI